MLGFGLARGKRVGWSCTGSDGDPNVEEFQDLVPLERSER